jgi:hypothetical protein
MNVKGLLGNQVPTSPIRAAEKVDRSIHSDASHDRDANGQQAFGGQQEQGSMSDEQLKKAIEHLRQLAAVKEHKWSVDLVIENEKKFVLIKDVFGALIRRIPEADLWTLSIDDQGPQKGHLLKKTA